MTTGTNDISTLLAARDQSVAVYGLNRIQDILAGELARHNGIVMGLVGDLADFTTDRLRKYGISVNGDMYEVDEYGRAPTQLAKPGATVGFPLRLFQYSVGWTRKWFEMHTPADMAIQMQAAERAHLRMLSREIKRSFMLSANYTWTDFLVDNVDVPVKRLVNADSAAIPEGPNGEVFVASTHTHYNSSATLTIAAVQANIDDVVEHGNGQNVKIAISRTDEAAFRALVGFVAYLDPRIISPTTATITGTPLDITRMDNRAIGIFGGAEVWVKSWMPANYLFTWDAAGDRPLMFRQRNGTGVQGMRIVGEIDAQPLHSQFMEAEFGVGVWNRTNGAFLYFASGTFADPVISS